MKKIAFAVVVCFLFAVGAQAQTDLLPPWGPLQPMGGSTGGGGGGGGTVDPGTADDVAYYFDATTVQSNSKLSFGAPGVVVNRTGSAAVDLQVQGDTDACLFTTDASADNVGIGTCTPLGKLHIEGTNASLLEYFIRNLDAAGPAQASVIAGAGANANRANMQMRAYGASGAGTTFGISNALSAQVLAQGSFGLFGTTIMLMGSQSDIPIVLGQNNIERERWGTTETVINEPGGDYDFRIESDTFSSAFAIDGATGDVGIGVAPIAGQLVVARRDVNDQTLVNVVNATNGVSARTVLQVAGDTAGVWMLSTSSTYNGFTNIGQNLAPTRVGAIAFPGGNSANVIMSLFTGSPVPIDIIANANGTTLFTRHLPGPEGSVVFGADGTVTAVEATVDVRGTAGTPALIVNNNGVNSDSRIESDTATHMFFVDASADTIGINNATPLSRMDVQGSIACAISNIDSGDSPFDLNFTHCTLICDASGGAVTFNLPVSSAAVRRWYNVKKVDATANACTIDPNGAETIDGAATRAITTQYENITFQSDGATWWIL